MSEKRFSYNPFKVDFIECNECHSLALYNKGLQKQFDEYIRGIIINKTLFLRTYYPFDDLNELTITELRNKSRTLLETELHNVLKLIRKRYNLTVDKIIFNADNDLLKGERLANI